MKYFCLWFRLRLYRLWITERDGQTFLRIEGDCNREIS